MSRDLQSSITTALEGEVVQPYMAVDLAFDGANLRLWTGVGDLTISSNTYTGAGTLLSISNIEETAEIAAKGATLVLSGIPSSIYQMHLLRLIKAVYALFILVLSVAIALKYFRGLWIK